MDATHYLGPDQRTWNHRHHLITQTDRQKDRQTDRHHSASRQAPPHYSDRQTERHHLMAQTDRHHLMTHRHPDLTGDGEHFHL